MARVQVVSKLPERVGFNRKANGLPQLGAKMSSHTELIGRGRDNPHRDDFLGGLLAIWFLLPWLCFLVGALSIAICLVTREWNNPWPVAVGLGGIGLGQALLLLQGRATILA